MMHICPTCNGSRDDILHALRRNRPKSIKDALAMAEGCDDCLEYVEAVIARSKPREVAA